MPKFWSNKLTGLLMSSSKSLMSNGTRDIWNKKYYKLTVKKQFSPRGTG
jgi:hypothetical protein